ncbi:MAG: hypothetical protein LBO73_03360 [Holosporaceae bacterium]|jgi:hypothetical protein|nr:hypothetical protein [Holosporaceae bacterium]
MKKAVFVVFGMFFGCHAMDVDFLSEKSREMIHLLFRKINPRNMWRLPEEYREKFDHFLSLSMDCQHLYKQIEALENKKLDGKTPEYLRTVLVDVVKPYLEKIRAAETEGFCLINSWMKNQEEIEIRAGTIPADVGILNWVTGDDYLRDREILELRGKITVGIRKNKTIFLPFHMTEKLLHGGVYYHKNGDFGVYGDGGTFLRADYIVDHVCTDAVSAILKRPTDFRKFGEEDDITYYLRIIEEALSCDEQPL